jgi:hypothetical protein
VHGVDALRLAVKGLVFFALLNLAYAWLDPSLDRISIYNRLVPGKPRFPAQYIPSVNMKGRPTTYVPPIEALFNSHVISGSSKPSQEYRVYVLGDSQTWGASVSPANSLVGQLNGMELGSVCGRRLRFFNLAAPYPSVLKDFLILKRAQRYEPDLVVWVLTLDSFRADSSYLRLAEESPRQALTAFKTYGLGKYVDLLAEPPSFIQRTPLHQASRIRRWAQLQLEGVVWAATGQDLPWQPAEFAAALYEAFPSDAALPPIDRWHGFSPPLSRSELAFRVLTAVQTLLGPTPVLVVVEPMFINENDTASPRYNLMYPRWAFDAFVPMLEDAVKRRGWHFLDEHDLVPASEFVDATYHLNQKGEAQLADALAPKVIEFACP